MKTVGTFGANLNLNSPCWATLLHTYSDLSEAFVEHGHQQLGQHNNHHNVIGTDDHGAHKRAQLFGVADARDKECNMCQGEDVPE